MSNADISILSGRFSGGKNSFALGKNAFAYGNGVSAIGDDSYATGISSSSNGKYSHAEGSYTRSSGTASHAEGMYTKTSNQSEHAQGQYNVSNKKGAGGEFGINASGNTLHSIGFGTSESTRKNAVEVMQNGDVYVYGVGGYLGNTIAGASTLASTLSAYATKNDLSNEISSKSNINLSSITRSYSKGGMLPTLNIMKFDSLETYNLCVDANPNLVGLSDLVLIDESRLNAEMSTIISVATPENSTDAANKEYVDDQISSVSQRFSDISANTAISAFYYTVKDNGVDAVTSKTMLSAMYSLISIFGYGNSQS